MLLISTANSTRAACYLDSFVLEYQYFAEKDAAGKFAGGDQGQPVPRGVHRGL